MTADLPIGFWAGWVAVVAVVSLLGLCWLVFSIYFSKEKHEPAGEIVWDENLREENNPAPMWWFWLMFALLIFSLVYLMLYPGLGSFKGILNWSQGNRLAESYAIYERDFGSERERILKTSIAELVTDENAMASARRIYQRHCAACHGQTGAGQANLFPALNDAEWQWGGAPALIEQTIRQGRVAAMPGWAAAVGEDGVAQLADYLIELGSSSSSAKEHSGASTYATYCLACHGTSGKGNVALGAPDLTNPIWLYGGSRESIVESIANGRTGVMPAFNDRLDDTQIHLLVAWLVKGQSTSSDRVALAGK